MTGFLLRFVVNYIAEDFRFLRMLESQKAPERTTLTLAELTELQHERARRSRCPHTSIAASPTFVAS